MMTYAKGVEMLACRYTRKLGNNTYLSRHDENTLAVRLHATDVVMVHADGTYTLNSGGWQTVTTKARLNEHSPARVSQRKGIWYVSYADSEVVYQDGMKVDSNGAPLGKYQDNRKVEAAKRKLDKLCRKYVKGFAAAAVERGGLEQPSAGDCFLCQLKDAQGNTVMGTDHIMSHMQENYYVPSLLWNALQVCGNPSLVWHMIDADVKNGRTDYLEQRLTAYLRKQKPELLKLVA